MLLSPENLKDFMIPIVESSSLFENKTVRLCIVANPCAGGFTRKKVSKKNFEQLEKISNNAKNRTKVTSVEKKLILETSHPGEGNKMISELLQNLPAIVDEVFSEEGEVQPQKGFQILVVTAGGDGTHLEVQTAILKKSLENPELGNLIKKYVTILRLPLGTGNDGSDGRTLEEAFARLTEPAHFSLQRAIKVWYDTTGKNPISTEKYESLDSLPPWYAFNIASVGIDAFITYMTNRTKKYMPGDTYQLWVDLACVFYSWKFPAKPLTLEIFDDNDNIVETITSPVEFVVLGVSGNRTYGSNHLIFPTDKNLCTVRKINLFMKLLKKHTFSDGTHINYSFSKNFFANKIKITYNQKILVEMDGEVHLLEPDFYPLYMEKTEPIIPIIECNNQAVDKGAVPYIK